MTRKFFQTLLGIMMLLVVIPVANIDAQGARRTSGSGGTIQFNTGEYVQGAWLAYIDDWWAEQCYVVAEAPGKVISGVVNPFPAERTLPQCVFQPPAETAQAAPVADDPPYQDANVTYYAPSAPAPVGPPAPQRRASGTGQSMWFVAGEQVQGFNIRFEDNRIWQQCRFDQAPANGWVLDGVVYPGAGEVAQLSVCDLNNPSNRGAPSAPAPAQQYSGQSSTSVTTSPGPGGTTVNVDVDQQVNVQQPPPVIFRREPVSRLEPNTAPVNAPPPFSYPGQPPVTTYPGQPGNPLRQETGVGGTLSFTAGTPVAGARITLIGGQTLENCYLASPQTGGSVTSGVLHPNPGEIGQACSQSGGSTGQRQETGEGRSLPFAAGEPLIGAKIEMGAIILRNCYLASPQANGIVTSGVKFPNPAEIQQARAC